VPFGTPDSVQLLVDTTTQFASTVCATLPAS
jgi:hypothetical protein